jgi:hypothetical protein
MKQFNSDKISHKLILSILSSFIVLNLIAQSDQVDNLAQFLFPEFSKSIIKMKAGNDLTLMLNYNIVTENMVFLQKGQVFDMLNQQNVDTIVMNSKKFVPVGKSFQEVLLTSPLILSIQHKGKIQEPAKPAAYGGTSEVSSSTYLTRLDFGNSGNSIYNKKLPEELIVKPETVYWIGFKNNKYSFTNERQFLKIFPGKDGEIKKYIKLNHFSFENAEDVIKVATYSYALIK